MKWIGQHIWDFISRFRSKVYLEDVANAGSDTDAFLVKKADGEVAVRTGAEVLSDIGASSESTDLEFNGSTANGVLTYGGAAQIDVESTMTYTSDILLLDSSTSAKPVITLSNSNTDADAPIFNFWKTANGADDDELGVFRFIGEDVGGGTNTFAEIVGSIKEADIGSEAGTLKFNVAENDGTVTTGLKLEGQPSDDGEIDVTIGAGVASTTTLSGNLKGHGQDNLLISGVAQKPIFEIKNTTDDLSSPIIKLNNARTDDATDGDFCGIIQFWGMDDGLPNYQQYGEIYTRIEDATDNEESGEMYLRVASHDGDMAQGLRIKGGSEDGEVDVEIGNGSDSLTTIAGDVAVGGDGITATGALRITSNGNMVTNAITGNNTISTNAVDGQITLESTHTAGTAVHIDANADAGSILDIDAGILDIDVTGITTLDTTELTIAGKAIVPVRKYELPSSTVGDYKGGDIYYYGDGSTVKGKIYYIDGTNWTLADADAEASTSGLLAVALGTNPDVDGMLLRGFVTLLTEVEGTEAIGTPIYLSATDSGIATITPPASGDFVRVLGYCLHASDNQVYFNPDNTWIERA